jgi:GTP-binding protein EngB required for normal cell division
MNDLEALQQLERLTQEGGTHEIAASARELMERAAEGRFYVACVGQFKRGKSTLINALLGHAVLPTGVVPVTAVPTVIRSGEPSARVQLRESGWQPIRLADLADYITEERNPGNTKGVVAAEVFLRAPLLGTGLCLVDTPGLGSVFEASTAAARAFVPHIDAAVVVLGADPPISADELALVSEAAEHMSDLLFVINKMDRVPHAERQEAIAFTQRVLRERLGRSADHLFEVSALAALSGEGDAGAWSSLVAALDHLAATRRAALVGSAVRRGIERLAARLAYALQEERAALTRPLDDTERRVEALRQVGAGAERALAELGPLLSGEQARLRQRFAEARQRFLDRVLPVAHEELQHRLAALATPRGRLPRAAALEAANVVARTQLDPWLVEAERDAEATYESVMGRFVELGRDLLTRLGHLAGREGMARLLRHEPEEGFRTKRGFYFHHLLHRHGRLAPWRRFLELVLPAPAVQRRTVQAAVRYLDDLLAVNAMRVEGDLNDRVQEGRRQFEAEMARLLRDALAAAEQALVRARQAQAAGEDGVRAALTTVDRRLDEVQQLRSTASRAA